MLTTERVVRVLESAHSAIVCGVRCVAVKLRRLAALIGEEPRHFILSARWQQILREIACALNRRFIVAVEASKGTKIYFVPDMESARKIAYEFSRTGKTTYLFDTERLEIVKM